LSTDSRGQALRVFGANFQELYERHLCRHSQFGINVGHLAGVVGTYLALYAMLYLVTGSAWVVLAVAGTYLAVLAFNLPLRVFLVTAVFLTLFFAGFFQLPLLGWAWAWVYPAAVLVLYQIQVVSHRIFTKERDMTDFNKKYPKGFALFILLSVYELPILLNYLVFGKRDWCA
jgi:hypothetical protein